MKKLLASTAFAAMALAAGVATAADSAVSYTVTATGHIDPGCTGVPATTSTLLQGLPDFASHVASGVAYPPMTLATVSCNNAQSRVTASSANKGLSNGSDSCATATAGTANCVFYDGAASWDGIAANFQARGSAATAGSGNHVGTGSAALTLSITPVVNSNMLAGGDFTDTVTVAVTPY